MKKLTTTIYKYFNNRSCVIMSTIRGCVYWLYYYRYYAFYIRYV